MSHEDLRCNCVSLVCHLYEKVREMFYEVDSIMSENTARRRTENHDLVVGRNVIEFNSIEAIDVCPPPQRVVEDDAKEKKLDNCCVPVENRMDLSAPSRSSSFKEKFHNAFSEKKRLETEYAQRISRDGDSDADFSLIDLDDLKTSVEQSTQDLDPWEIL